MKGEQRYMEWFGHLDTVQKQRYMERDIYSIYVALYN